MKSRRRFRYSIFSGITEFQAVFSALPPAVRGEDERIDERGAVAAEVEGVARTEDVLQLAVDAAERCDGHIFAVRRELNIFSIFSITKSMSILPV